MCQNHLNVGTINKLTVMMAFWRFTFRRSAVGRLVGIMMLSAEKWLLIWQTDRQINTRKWTYFNARDCSIKIVVKCGSFDTTHAEASGEMEQRELGDNSIQSDLVEEVEQQCIVAETHFRTWDIYLRTCNEILAFQAINLMLPISGPYQLYL